MGLGKGKDAQAFGEIFFSPLSEFGLLILPLFDEDLETFFGVLTGVRVEDGFDFGGDGAFEFLLGDVVLRVLLKVELAALPGACVERGFEGRFESAVGV